MEVLTSVACYNINTRYPVYANLFDKPLPPHNVCIDILYLLHNTFVDYNSMSYLLYIFSESIPFEKYINYSINKYLIYLHHNEWFNEVFLPDNIVYLCLCCVSINFNKIDNLQYYNPIRYINHKINVLYLVCINVSKDDIELDTIAQYLEYVQGNALDNYTILPNIYRKISTMHPELSYIIRKLDNSIKRLKAGST
jgi:hypothetical protein